MPHARFTVPEGVTLHAFPSPPEGFRVYSVALRGRADARYASAVANLFRVVHGRTVNVDGSELTVWKDYGTCEECSAPLTPSVDGFGDDVLACSRDACGWEVYAR